MSFQRAKMLHFYIYQIVFRSFFMAIQGGINPIYGCLAYKRRGSPKRVAFSNDLTLAVRELKSAIRDLDACLYKIHEKTWPPPI